MKRYLFLASLISLFLVGCKSTQQTRSESGREMLEWPSQMPCPQNWKYGSKPSLPVVMSTLETYVGGIKAQKRVRVALDPEGKIQKIFVELLAKYLRDVETDADATKAGEDMANFPYKYGYPETVPVLIEVIRKVSACIGLNEQLVRSIVKPLQRNL